MKIQGWVFRGLLLICITCGSWYGCAGDQNSTQPSPQGEEPSPQSPEAPPAPEMLEVAGSARFGNQCPYGSYVSPVSVPIELWECPLRLPKLELSEPLPSLILQADCKKKTLDVRSEDPSIPAVTWEVMPDGNFYFTFGAGSAKIKDDGEGHTQCSAPMVAYMWGKVDCKDRDQATIKVETVWRLGLTVDDIAGPSPSPSVGPVPIPSSGPFPGPSSLPHPAPSSQPTSVPSAVPSPAPHPTTSPVPSRRRPQPPHRVSVHPVRLGSSPGDAPACQLPQGCYFHSITRIDQCS